MARIALDAMGGDFAPEATVAGALQALRELGDRHVIQLVGRTADIQAELAKQGGHGNGERGIEIVDAPDVITMSDKPTAVLRGKPNSSMALGVRLQAEKKSDAFVSAGNTGAQMAASAMMLKLHAGLTRPAIATVFPTARKPLAILDVGANVDCSARELMQFAWLGAVYAETVLGRKNPAVGLLSIGEEAEKGNAVVKEANALFATAGFNFIGNIEGRDIPRGRHHTSDIDVVVCDGFVGNVILKFYEAVMPMVVSVLREHGGINEDHVQEGLSEFDPSKYGAAPLLGVRGVSLICHGNSSARAIQIAIGDAARAVELGMDAMIGQRLSQAASAVSAATAAPPAA